MKFTVMQQGKVHDKTVLCIAGDESGMSNNLPFVTNDGRRGVVLSVGISRTHQSGMMDVLTDLPFGKQPSYIQTNE